MRQNSPSATAHRFAEDTLAQVISAGVRQYVLLGAGLDTFAYRNPYVSLGLRIFEADHPATQAWKRGRLADARISVPPELTFVPIDFERESLRDRLMAAGRHSSPGWASRPISPARRFSKQPG